MSCYNCVRKDYCQYISYFNIDKNVGCIEFQDRDHTTHLANTLNEEIDCKYDLATTRIIRSNKAYLSNDIKSIVYKDKEYDIKILKAFDIIKEKKVDVSDIFATVDYADYKRMCDEWKQPLPQKEYDILKEVLK